MWMLINNKNMKYKVLVILLKSVIVGYMHILIKINIQFENYLNI